MNIQTIKQHKKNNIDEMNHLFKIINKRGGQIAWGVAYRNGILSWVKYSLTDIYYEILDNCWALPRGADEDEKKLMDIANSNRTGDGYIATAHL